VLATASSGGSTQLFGLPSQIVHAPSQAAFITYGDASFAYGYSYVMFAQSGIGQVPFKLNSIQKPYIAAGYFPVLIVDQATGNLYGHGDATLGKLGLGSNVDQASTPTLIKVGVPVSNKIAAGLYHSMVVSQDLKSLYSFGYSYDGQACFPSYNFYPTLVNTTSMGVGGTSSNITIAQVAAGKTHSLILLSDSRMYACGDNCTFFAFIFLTQLKFFKLTSTFSL